MLSLFDLPFDIIQYVLNVFVDIKGFGKLEMAICSECERNELLFLFSPQ